MRINKVRVRLTENSPWEKALVVSREGKDTIWITEDSIVFGPIYDFHHVGEGDGFILE